ncbi:unnamed protein product [Effrenium voratum]|uniref:EF-hand domain-containing protein n=1 Tax=Effrenium voratum TaxID=2562239 RepID=A0AA36J3N3_9DINO|nr:unnamed protein product [Effrenium voratum]
MAMMGANPFNQRVAQCAMWEKVREGHVHLITQEDVENVLLNFEEHEASGHVSTLELVRLAGLDGTYLTSEEIRDWIKDADKDGLGRVTAEDLHRAITKGSVAFSLVKKAMFGKEQEHKLTECSLDEILKWLHYEYEKNSNLWSLPQTLVLFSVFVMASALHLNVWEAYKLTRVWTTVMSQGDYLQWWVVDVSTLMLWLEQAFLRNVLRQDMISWLAQPEEASDPLVSNPFPGRVLQEGQVVGAVRLRRWHSIEQPCNTGTFYKELVPTCFLKSELYPEDWFMFYHEKRTVIEQDIQDRTNQNWLDLNTAYLDIQVLTYNAHQAMFFFGTNRYQWMESGRFIIRDGPNEAFVDGPYFNLLYAVPDLIFILMLWGILYGELKEAIPAAMNGLDGIKDYLAFWNVVDWFAICFGITTVCFWLNFVLAVGGLPKLLSTLPSDALDLAVFSNQSYLERHEFNGVVDRLEFEQQMADIFNLAEETSEAHRIARWMILGYLFVLMFKFFKAFRSNDRLDVVIQTITDSAVDVAHFAFAFALVFSGFALGGMMLFGTKVQGFHTLVSSLFFCWRGGIGMDDVESFEVWFQVLAYFWHFSYLGLMSILMINILVGLIFEAYGRIRSGAGEPPTLLEQVGEAVDTLKETKSFLDMWYIICELEDDDFPAHPAPTVTVRSLKKAFAKDRMSKDNAEYLVESASMYAKKQAKKVELSVSDGVRMIGQTRTNAHKLMALSEQVNSLLKKFHMKHGEGSHDQNWTNLFATEKKQEVKETVEEDPLARNAKNVKQAEVVSRKAVSREETLINRMRNFASDLVGVTKEQNKLLDWISHTITERGQGITEKDSWARQKTAVLTDRCEKIEISVGKLGECLKGVDPTQLRNMPERLKACAERIHQMQMEDCSPVSGEDHISLFQSQLSSIANDVAHISETCKAKVDVYDALQRSDQVINRVLATYTRVVEQDKQTETSEDFSDLPGVTQTFTDFSVGSPIDDMSHVNSGEFM